jgi:MFS transporter, ACS family, tartrate transporter
MTDTGIHDAQDQAVGRRALSKASWRLLPLIGLGYGIAYMDRANIGYAALQMSDDLKFSATVYGLGGGLFFLSYALLEVPSNLMLLRFGARRWIARIMITWGILAVGMMFVTTPMQFYVMRFLLGAAEAGFFPGVMFYLMHWFPAYERGRAVSRFYVALPLSMVLMGVISGALLDLQGLLGLAGWQWLFMVQGMPAVLLGIAIFFVLPDSPANAAWLTTAERNWIKNALAADATIPGASTDHGVLRALLDPRVLLLGICNVCVMGTSYAFFLSAPTLLRDATQLDATHVGFLIAAAAGCGAIAMIFAGWYSDRRRERHLHLAVYLILQAAAFVVMSLASAPSIYVAAYAAVIVAMMAVQAVFFLIPGDIFRGKSAAAGLAAIGSIGMIGAFLGPWFWGIARDFTGSYRAGLLSLFFPILVAAAIMLVLRRQAHNARLVKVLADPVQEAAARV